MRDAKDAVIRIEREDGSITIDRQGVVTISAPVITVNDLVDKPGVSRGGDEE